MSDELADFDDEELDEELVDDPAHDEAVREMYELHRDVGRKALQIALDVLDKIDPAEIPVNVAVQLLKFGADLERRAVLGIEPEGDDDPFSALAKSLEGR